MNFTFYSPNFKIKYCDNLKHLLKSINEDNVCISTFANKTEAQAYINAYCDKLISIIHKAVYMSKGTFNGNSCNKRRNYWWNSDCTLSRNRLKFWFTLWKSCDRPRQGVVFDCFKNAKYNFMKTLSHCCK